MKLVNLTFKNVSFHMIQLESGNLITTSNVVSKVVDMPLTRMDTYERYLTGFFSPKEPLSEDLRKFLSEHKKFLRTNRITVVSRIWTFDDIVMFMILSGREEFEGIRKQIKRDVSIQTTISEVEEQKAPVKMTQTEEIQSLKNELKEMKELLKNVVVQPGLPPVLSNTRGLQQ